MSCVYKRQWLYRPTLVIRNINLNKYDIKCLNNLMILSIYKEEVDNLDIKSIVNNIIKNGDDKLDNIPRWWESKTGIWVQVTISLIYYRFIVRFTIRLEFLFITFLLQFFLTQMSSLSISSSATYNPLIFEYRQLPKSVNYVRYCFKRCTTSTKNCIKFCINCMLFYKKCVHLYDNKMYALLQKVCVFLYKKVCILFFKHTYKVLLRFRPSNIKMLSTCPVMYTKTFR